MAQLSWQLPWQVLKVPGQPSGSIKVDLNKLVDWTGLCWSLYIVIVDHQLPTKEDITEQYIWSGLWVELSTSMEKKASVTELESCAPGNKMLEGQNNCYELSTLGLVLFLFWERKEGKTNEERALHVLILHDGARGWQKRCLVLEGIRTEHPLGVWGLRPGGRRCGRPVLTSEHRVKNHLLQNLVSVWGSSTVQANLSSISL